MYSETWLSGTWISEKPPQMELILRSLPIGTELPLLVGQTTLYIWDSFFRFIILVTSITETANEDEIRILYQYLAEGSVVFPKVFPVIHSLLDMKINHFFENFSVVARSLELCLVYGNRLTPCYVGLITQMNQCTAESSELFVNCLEAMVETCLPGGDEALTRAPPPDPDHPDPCDQHRYPGELERLFQTTKY
ncbi:hypothetical protein SFRURICE_002415 [Spodoptera frugiperda]|nr:hypothetical protein SFRURICE_002415 [Spodoptera frugiperda]